MDLLEGLSQRQETACPVGCPEAENSIIPPPCLGFPSSTQSTCTKRLRFKSFLALACPSCVAVVSVSFAPLTLAGRPPVCVPFSRLAWALLQSGLAHRPRLSHRFLAHRFCMEGDHEMWKENINQTPGCRGDTEQRKTGGNDKPASTHWVCQSALAKLLHTCCFI